MKILHLEDDPDDAELVRRLILTEWPGSEITLCSRGDECSRALRASRFDLILSDFTMPSFDGMDALQTSRSLAPDTPFIFLSGTIGEDRAIEAVHRGADDYVLKDRMKRLTTAIRRSLHEHALRRQRTEAERRIREQAEMLNQAQDAILVTDLAGRIIYWNTGAEALFGWPASEVLGMTAGDMFTPESQAALKRARIETERQGSWRGELELNDKARRPIVVDTRRTLIRDDSGLPKAHLSISTDMTTKKQMEEQLLRVQRLENIGLLAAGIAHDLNNVLAPVLLVAPMLRDRMTNPEDLGMLSVLEKSAERGAGLVRQILSFAQGTGGENRTIQLRHLVGDIASIVSETFPKNVRFEDHTRSDLWAIDANPTQIHQVILNLCVNARDAMPEGGVIRVAAENVVLDSTATASIEGARSGSFVKVAVEDTGNGIPPDVLENIWKPFFTTKEQGKGTGLGLSTVRGILEKHNGFISVGTQVGEGTCFTFYLPASPAAIESSAAIDVKRAGRGNGELILVVDDEAPVAELAATILTRAGYRVVVVANGADAVKLYAQRSQEIKAVVLDTHMADFDGPTVGRALHRMDPTVRIIAMSGLSLEGEQAESIMVQGHAAVFLNKPFKPEALLTAVHDVIHPELAGTNRS